MAALSLLALATVLLLWARSARHPGDCQFTACGVRWAVEWDRGRLVLHNGPQGQWEWQQWWRESMRLRAEGSSLNMRHRIATAHSLLKRGMSDGRAAYQEAQQLQYAISRNTGATLAHEAMPPKRTALVRYAAPLWGAAIAFAVLPAVSVGAVIRRLHQRRALLKPWAMRPLWLRPPRHAGAVPRMWNGRRRA